MHARNLGDRVWPLLAPILLAIVAMLQMTLSATADLSAWKGGGFGMFSTVDSPEARFLRITLITHDGDVPALPPGDLGRTVAQLRTAPTDGMLRAVAERIASGNWVPLEFASAARRYSELLRARPDAAALTREVGPPAEDEGVIRFPAHRLVRMLEPSETRDPAALVAFEGIRVEVWRYSLRRDHPALVAERLRSLTLARPS